ncbi:hypothetical protein QQG55_1415 [Brugia pahangi]
MNVCVYLSTYVIVCVHVCGKARSSRNVSIGLAQLHSFVNTRMTYAKKLDWNGPASTGETRSISIGGHNQYHSPGFRSFVGGYSGNLSLSSICSSMLSSY